MRPRWARPVRTGSRQILIDLPGCASEGWSARKGLHPGRFRPQGRQTPPVPPTESTTLGEVSCPQVHVQLNEQRDRQRQAERWRRSHRAAALATSEAQCRPRVAMARSEVPFRGPRQVGATALIAAERAAEALDLNLRPVRSAPQDAGTLHPGVRRRELRGRPAENRGAEDCSRRGLVPPAPDSGWAASSSEGSTRPAQSSRAQRAARDGCRAEPAVPPAGLLAPRSLAQDRRRCPLALIRSVRRPGLRRRGKVPGRLIRHRAAPESKTWARWTLERAPLAGRRFLRGA